MISRDVVDLGHGSYQISDFKLDNYYVVVGASRVAVIDCGCGLGDPMTEIRQISSLPVILILTHGHADHCGNAFHFNEVYMSPADKGLFTKMWGRDFISFYVHTRAPLRNPGDGIIDQLLELVPSSVPASFDFRPLADGQIFDLGGRELEVIATPGHTPGSVSVLDRSARLMYTGDAANDSSIIPNRPGGTRAEIIEFRSSIGKLLNRSDEFDHTCPGHDGVKYDLSILRDYAILCDSLLEGSLVGNYEERGIRKGRVARRGSVELWYEADA